MLKQRALRVLSTTLLALMLIGPGGFAPDNGCGTATTTICGD